MKNAIYIILSLIIIIIISFIILEGILQAIPYIYKLLPSSKDTICVYVLGESTCYGAPFQGKINFSKIICEKLNWTLDDKKIELINLAEPGCSLFRQYKKYSLYKYLHPYKKGIVLAYMGMNDWAIKKIDKNLQNNFFTNLKIITFIYVFFTRDLFTYNYEQIIKTTKSFGDEMFISTIAGNYSGYMPNKKTISKQLKDIKTIDDLFINKEYDKALSLSESFLNKYNNKSQFYYRIGKIYEQQNKIELANKMFINSVEFHYDERPTSYQNNKIIELANKYSIPYFDFFNELKNKKEIIGYNYFIDDVHPNINTHILLADRFINLLSSKYNIIKKDYPKDYFINKFKISKEDLFYNYTDALEVIIFFSLRGKIIDIYNYNIIKSRIEELEYLDQYMCNNNNVLESEKRKKIIYFVKSLFYIAYMNKEQALGFIDEHKVMTIIKKRVFIQFEDVLIKYILRFYYKNKSK